MRRELPIVISLIFFLVFFGSLLLFDLFQTPISSKATQLIISANGSYQPSQIYVPAVDNNGNGVVSTLKVQAIPGSGKILVNIDQLSYFLDTQTSIRTASQVASKYANFDLSKVDLVYSIDTPAQVI